MKLNEEQIDSFNRLMQGWVLNNKYIQKAAVQSHGLIVLEERNTVQFYLDCFSTAYQQKFMLKNFQLYCTQLFLAIKPQIIVFLKNEGLEYYTFRLLFLAGDHVYDKMETVTTWKRVDLYHV
ncbi:hypothetical protein [Pedobacter heparinus]|uniref:hypothetical protein n=1 Tax=Pedobacter heparinus TaxID=984 RepID=UPI00293188B5|nr:hypothetical protein [Pedobacter heparinus]